MSHRSHARFLAPLALIAAIVTIFIVARPELGGSSDPKGTTAASSTSASKSAQGKAGKRKSAKPKATPKTYTVKPGDVLGSISDSTGVSVADLLDYNDIDAQSLSVGQKLKLTP